MSAKIHLCLILILCSVVLFFEYGVPYYFGSITVPFLVLVQKTSFFVFCCLAVTIWLRGFIAACEVGFMSGYLSLVFMPYAIYIAIVFDEMDRDFAKYEDHKNTTT